MGQRKAINVSLDADLVDRAKALDINISQAIEPGLREIVREAEMQRWREENRGALESFSRYIEEHGAFGEEWRSW